MSRDTYQILIVDDEIDNCSNMADIFNDLGYAVDVAYDGPSALELVKQKHYDVALLDLMMPGMDGAGLYDEIKRVRAGTVAILVTAHPGHPRVSKALDSGVSKVLAKPVDLSNLIQEINRIANEPLLLIVDDDPDFCGTIWDLLRQTGYRVYLAHDVATANRLLSEDSNYDLVVLDMKLPDGDGTVVIRAAHQTHPETPIILVTGYRSEFEGDIPTLLSQGVKTVLSKPLEVPQLLQMVEELTTG